MDTPQMDPVGNVFCRGSIVLGSGCMRCGRCAVQLSAKVKTLEVEATVLRARATQAEAIGSKFLTVAKPVELSGKLIRGCAMCYGSGVTVAGTLCTCRPST